MSNVYFVFKNNKVLFKKDLVAISGRPDVLLNISSLTQNEKVNAINHLLIHLHKPFSPNGL